MTMFWARVIILPGRKIGCNAIVGAGSVVTQDVPDNAIVGGNPARVLRYRQETATETESPSSTVVGGDCVSSHA